MAKALTILFLVLTLLSRFWGINWGHGYSFHPDENNMAGGALSLQVGPDPRFYAYGELPLRLAVMGQNIFFRRQLTFTAAIYWLRFWSAIFSLGLIWLGYLLAKRWRWKPVWIYPLLLVFSPGLIQAAHFGTTESALALSLLAMIYFLDQLRENPQRWQFWLGLGLAAGFGLANKISALVFVLPAWLVALVWLRRRNWHRYLLMMAAALVTVLVFSPIYWQSWPRVWQTINYETAIARGQKRVFYTWQFARTIPFFFQFKKVFPWLLGLPAYLFFWLAVVKLWRRRFWQTSRSLIFLPALVWFLANGGLYVKWVRFMLPLLPVLLLAVAWFLTQIYRRRFFWPLFLAAILPGFLFLSLYFRPDIRWQATMWLAKLPSQSLVLEETGNVFLLPLVNPGHLQVGMVDFYRLDNDADEQARLAAALPRAQYIIIPSRRVFANYRRLPDIFPKTAQFYRQLFNGQFPFYLEKTFRPFPKWINIFMGMDLTSEETWTVFDHPTIRVFARRS